jgi:hypothetical protein
MPIGFGSRTQVMLWPVVCPSSTPQPTVYLTPSMLDHAAALRPARCLHARIRSRFRQRASSRTSAALCRCFDESESSTENNSAAVTGSFVNAASQALAAASPASAAAKCLSNSRRPMRGAHIEVSQPLEGAAQLHGAGAAEVRFARDFRSKRKCSASS